MEEFGFTKIFESEQAACYADEDQKTIGCVLKVEYVPIKKFKETFNALADEVKEAGTFEKFIFDKSALRTFHQPSMKWYFTEWKQELMDYGLYKHFKILPDIAWFKKSVEVARKPLEKKFPKEVARKLRIEYYESVADAIKAD